jgi:uncharacterized protein (TIGR03067 family)
MRPRNLIALVIPFALAAAEPSEEAIKKELKKLDGSWVATQTRIVTDKGKQVQFTQNFRLVVRDEDRFTLYQKFSDEKVFKEVVSGTLKVDPSKKPAHLDMTYPDAQEPSRCIYELTATQLKMVGGEPGGERPKEFSKEKTLLFKREARKK